MKAELFFWVHIGIVVFAIFMGFFFPLWAVVTVLIIHRLHIILLDGCALTHATHKGGYMPADESFLQHAVKRFFKIKLDHNGIKKVDYTIVAISLLIGFLNTYIY